MSVLIVEYTKPEQRKPKPTMQESFPLPWKIGEAKTGTCAIVDANFNRICEIRGGGIVGGGADSIRLAKMFVEFANAGMELRK
jgi:hypothetical protein